jgi:hypothetical protein
MQHNDFIENLWNIFYILNPYCHYLEKCNDELFFLHTSSDSYLKNKDEMLTYQKVKRLRMVVEQLFKNKSKIIDKTVDNSVEYYESLMEEYSKEICDIAKYIINPIESNCPGLFRKECINIHCILEIISSCFDNSYANCDCSLFTEEFEKILNLTRQIPYMTLWKLTEKQKQKFEK